MSVSSVPHPVLVEQFTAASDGRSRGTGRTVAFALDLGLVLAGLVVLTLLSQVAIPLPFTPVPLTLGTLGALLVGAALGPARGLGATGLYALLAALGAPVLAGWSTTGIATASFGYVIGYVLAGAALGWAARRGADRSVARTAIAAIFATALVYLPGVAWLMAVTGADLLAGLQMGMFPFLIGDAIKAVLAAMILPAAWSAVGRIRKR